MTENPDVKVSIRNKRGVFFIRYVDSETFNIAVNYTQNISILKEQLDRYGDRTPNYHYIPCDWEYDITFNIDTRKITGKAQYDDSSLGWLYGFEEWKKRGHWILDINIDFCWYEELLPRFKRQYENMFPQVWIKKVYIKQKKSTKPKRPSALKKKKLLYADYWNIKGGY